MGYYGLLTLVSLVTPLLGTALLVGVSVSLFQALSTIQEQTLSTGFKMFFVFGVMLAIGPWFLRNTLTFFKYIYENIPVFLIK